MPVVPLGEQQVQDAPLPGAQITARVSPTAEGADIGNAISESGVQLSDAIRVAQRHSRQIALQNVSTAGGNFSYDQLNDPDHGLLNKHGAQVFDDQGQVKPEFNKVFDDFAAFKAKQLEGISDPIAKERASAELDNRAKTMHYAIGQHIVQERTRYDGQMTDALVKTSQQNAEANASDPALVGMELDKQRGAIRDYGERNGTPKAAIDQQVATQVSATHFGVISQLLAGEQDAAASQYFAANKGEIVGQDLQRATAAVDGGSRRATALRLGDEITAEALKDGKQPTEDDLIAAVAAKTGNDPRLREQTEQRVLQLHGLHLAAIAEHGNAIHTQAYQQLVDPKNDQGILGVSPALLADLAQYPEKDVAIHAYAAQLARREAPATNWQVWYDMQAKLASSDPTIRQAAANKDLLEYRSQLADPQFQELAKLQGDVRKASNNPEALAKLQVGITTPREAGDDALRQIDIDPFSKDPVTQKRVIAFRQAYDNAIIAEKQSSGKSDLATEDYRKIALGLVSDAGNANANRGWANPARWFGDARDPGQISRTFEDPKAMGAALSLASVPPVDREAIISEAAKHGENLAPADIVARYHEVQAIRAQKAAAK